MISFTISIRPSRPLTDRLIYFSLPKGVAEFFRGLSFFDKASASCYHRGMTVRTMGVRLYKEENRMNNYEKYRQVRKEAAATGLLLLILIAAWIAAGFGLADVRVEFFHLPLWVWTATIGFWLFAILGVKLLTATVFVDMSLEEDEDDAVDAGEEVHHDK